MTWKCLIIEFQTEQKFKQSWRETMAISVKLFARCEDGVIELYEILGNNFVCVC